MMHSVNRLLALLAWFLAGSAALPLRAAPELNFTNL